MSAESGPSGTGLSGASFSAGAAEGISSGPSLGSVGTMSFTSDGEVSPSSFAISTSFLNPGEGGINSFSTDLSGGSKAESFTSFKGFEPYSANSLNASMDTAFHGDITNLSTLWSRNNTSNSKTSNLTSSHEVSESLSRSASDTSLKTINDTSVSEALAEADSIIAESLTFSRLIRGIENDQSSFDSLKSGELSEAEINPERSLEPVDSNPTEEVERIQAILTELESFYTLTDNLDIQDTGELQEDPLLTTLAETSQDKSSERIAGDATYSETDTTGTEAVTEITEPEQAVDPKITAIAEVIERELNPNDQHESTEVKKGGIEIATNALEQTDHEITHQELKKGVAVVMEMKKIDVKENEAIEKVAEVLSEPTYTLEEVGEKGEEQVVIEKIAQDINTEMPKPVIDEEVDREREAIALEAVDETIKDIQEYLHNEKDIDVPETEIWISGTNPAESILNQAPISGILEEDPDGSKIALAKDIAGDWMTISSASAKINEGIRKHAAVKVAVQGKKASEAQVHEVLNGQSAGIIYGRKY